MESLFNIWVKGGVEFFVCLVDYHELAYKVQKVKAKKEVKNQAGSNPLKKERKNYR